MTLESLHAAMNAPLPSCCAYHADQLPNGTCREGRDCPARKAEREASRDETDDQPPTPEDAMSWPYLLLLGVISAVVLGSALAFAMNNWALIEMSVSDFF